jgi:predicted nucleic acid-binding protein
MVETQTCGHNRATRVLNGRNVCTRCWNKAMKAVEPQAIESAATSAIHRARLALLVEVQDRLDAILRFPFDVQVADVHLKALGSIIGRAHDLNDSLCAAEARTKGVTNGQER